MNIHYDAVKFIEAGVTVETDSGTPDVARVFLSGEPGAFYVEMHGDTLVLFPERAASHRELLKALGVDGPSLPDWMKA